VAKLKVSEGKIMSSSSDLSLFLCLRDIYLEQFNEKSKENNTLMHIEVVGNKKYLQHANSLIKA